MNIPPSQDTLTGIVALLCALTVFVAAALDPPADIARPVVAAVVPAH